MKRYKPNSLLFFLLMTLLFFPGLSMDSNAGTVTGTMQMRDGTPMAEGKILFFDSSEGEPPVPGTDFRPPTVVELLDKEGSFTVNIQAGEYYFGAVLWVEGTGPGPPEPGDSFFIIRDRTIVIPENGLVELGEVAEGEIFQEEN